MRSKARFVGRVIKGSRPGPYPGFVEPELATSTAKPPSGGNYVHEVKFDGYRIQAHVRAGRVALYTRSGLNWTEQFPTIAAGIKKIPAQNVILDGEVVSTEQDGRTNFSTLQDDLSGKRTERIAYYAFDLLYLDGFDLRAAPLIERKRVLAGLLDESKTGNVVLYSEHFETSGADMFRQACALNLEGIVSKLKTARYRSDRTRDWLKIKCSQIGRYEVIGFKSAPGSLGALYLGKRENGQLLYAGKAGTGYTHKMAADLRKILNPYVVKKSPLAKRSPKPIDTWVTPKFWAEVDYRDITNAGILRHVIFRGFYDSTKSKKPIVARGRNPPLDAD